MVKHIDGASDEQNTKYGLVNEYKSKLDVASAMCKAQSKVLDEAAKSHGYLRAERDALRVELAAVNTHADGIMKEALRWKDERDELRELLREARDIIDNHAEFMSAEDYDVFVARVEAVLAKGETP